MSTNLFDYWVPAVKNIYGSPLTEDSCRRLDSLFEKPYFKIWIETKDCADISDECVPQLKMLMGPYGRVVAKMMEAKRQLERRLNDETKSDTGSSGADLP